MSTVAAVTVVVAIVVGAFASTASGVDRGFLLEDEDALVLWSKRMLRPMGAAISYAVPQ
jgi:hypothetical protein